MFNGAKCMRRMLGAVALMGLAAVPAAAELAFEGTLSGELEVPPSGSTAYGVVIIITDNAMTEAAFTEAARPRPWTAGSTHVRSVSILSPAELTDVTPTNSFPFHAPK